MKTKNIKQGVLFVSLFLLTFVVVRAFVIETDVTRAIQYIQRTIYTDNGTQSGTVLLDIGYDDQVGQGDTGPNAWIGGDVRSSGSIIADGDLRIGNDGFFVGDVEITGYLDVLQHVHTSGSVRADKYCDEQGNHCSSPEDLVITGEQLDTNYIPLIVGPRALGNSEMYQIGTNDAIVIGSHGGADVDNLKLYVDGTGRFYGNITSDHDIEAGDSIISPLYCDENGNCYNIHTDFYTTGHIDANYYTQSYIDNNFYDTGHIDVNYYTQTYIDNNLYTTGYISGHFQDDINSTVCIYGFSGVADDGSVSCAVNNDTNFYATGIAFNSGNGILTLMMSGTSDHTTSLDQRYLTGEDDPVRNAVSGDYYTTGESDSRYVVSGYTNNISDFSVPYQSGGALHDSPLSVSGSHVVSNNAIVVGDTSDTSTAGMIKFSGDNHFYGYLGATSGRVQLDN